MNAFQPAAGEPILPAQASNNSDDSPDRLTWYRGLTRAERSEEQPPRWLDPILELFATAHDAENNESSDQSPSALLTLFAPLLHKARADFREMIVPYLAQRAGELGTAVQFEAVWYMHLAERLLALVARPCLLKLSFDRQEKRLPGGTPAARFQAFIGSLRSRQAALDFVHEYPVLARQVDRCLTQWQRAGLEFVKRLTTDRDLIRATLLGDRKPGPIVRVEAGKRDWLRGEACEFIVHFRSGDRVVYKPRSLAVEARFGELIGWLNAHGAEPGLRAARVIDRDRYGWAEYVRPRSCSHTAEVERFYRRQGMLLCLLRVLAARGFDSEMLVADGEQPILVDLESLFQHDAHGAATGPLEEGLARSVLAVGLLPSAQSVPKSATSLQWVEVGTDQMHLAPKLASVAPKNHLPRLSGTSVGAETYEPALLQGFVAMYRLLERHRDELLSASGPIAAFRTTVVRFAARPKGDYLTLLDQSVNPSSLRDGIDQDRLFDRLSDESTTVNSLDRLRSAEIQDLHRHELPRFTTQAGSRDIWTSQEKRIGNFLPKSGLESAFERLALLGSEDLAREEWLIRSTLALQPDASSGPNQLTLDAGGLRLFDDQITTATRDLNDEKHRSVCRDMAERLCRLAWQDKHEADWTDLVSTSGGWTVGAVPIAGECGLIAIAVFLVRLACVTGEQIYRVLAHKGIASLARRLSARSEPLSAVEHAEVCSGLREMNRLEQETFGTTAKVAPRERVFLLKPAAAPSASVQPAEVHSISALH
jgi:type 2 lantibiotic biosynthesis protein LanM